MHFTNRHIEKGQQSKPLHQPATLPPITAAFRRADHSHSLLSRMIRSQGLKRKQPELGSGSQSLSGDEQVIYKVVKSRENIGISARDLKQEAKQLRDREVTKSIKSLMAKNLIKEVVNIRDRGRKLYMAMEFEPSKEITGGTWYTGGTLDTELIRVLKDACFKFVGRMKVATLEGLTNDVNGSRVFAEVLTKQQIEEILNSLVLEDKVIEVKSNGMGDFGGVPIGKICYKSVGKGKCGEELKIGAMASIPCGVCPRISLCTPDGVVSPQTCVYYTRWLEMDF